MKIGIDFHGVIDANPLFFSEFSKLLVKNQQEVHIITGTRGDECKVLLEKRDIAYTHLFSITDYLLSEMTEFEIKKLKTDSYGHYEFYEGDWIRAKGEYCYREGISLHIDDSLIYSNFFKTPFALYKK